jgi:hypothetical protein
MQMTGAIIAGWQVKRNGTFHWGMFTSICGLPPGYNPKFDLTGADICIGQGRCRCQYSTKPCDLQQEREWWLCPFFNSAEAYCSECSKSTCIYHADDQHLF